MFVTVLEKKVTRAGGEMNQVSTFATKASQYNHTTDEYRKKKLSVRWDIMADGTKVQRDLYSAYLLKHVDRTLVNYDKRALIKDFTSFLAMHEKEIERLKRLKKNDMPSSCGLRKL